MAKKSNYRKPTLTVAISAFNEEKNIVKFLNSILIQKEDGFTIQAIWLHSDGSTDKTVQLARTVKNRKIKIWDHKKRRGKSTWLNQIYRSLKSDFLIQSDADVVFAHPLVIHDIIQPLVKEKNVAMCGGNPKPIDGESFWERIVVNAFEPYLSFRSQVRGGNNAFSAIGQILAYRKELLKSITVPSDMITNDLYTYFCCLYLGWQYRFVPPAVVLFQSPTRLKDILRQNTRFQAGHLRMFKYFPRDLVIRELNIPKHIRILSLLKQFMKHPILSSAYFIINAYCRVKAYQSGSRLNAKWAMAETTKKLRST